MEARISNVAAFNLVRNILLCKLVIVGVAYSLVCGKSLCAQANYRAESTNFVVHAPDSRLAQTVARKAEGYRKELSIEWLGYEIPRWRERCPIQVEIGMHAGGETSFAFVDNVGGKGTPISWQMRIFGPPDRLLDAVLPHEVTHTIFATHFGRPLPRWADEGACTTVEHASEREKNHHMLIDFLTSKPSRGIPFNRMFVMRDYPNDILPLYAQGYSLARFLINQKGKRKFVDYVSAGLNAESGRNPIAAWDRVTSEVYGYENLSELQLNWLAWVKRGSLDDDVAATFAVANSDKPLHAADSVRDAAESWYVQQAQTDSNERVAANRQSISAAQTELKRVHPNHWMPKSQPGVRLNTIWR